MAVDEEEYELMPLTPLRKLEKEVQAIREMRTPSLDRDLIHELIESNITTQRKLNKMLESLELMNTNFNEFLNLFKYASKEEVKETKVGHAPTAQVKTQGMDVLIAQNERLIRGIDELSKHVKQQVYETKYKPDLAKKLSPGKTIRYSRTMSKEL